MEKTTYDLLIDILHHGAVGLDLDTRRTLVDAGLLAHGRLTLLGVAYIADSNIRDAVNSGEDAGTLTDIGDIAGEAAQIILWAVSQSRRAPVPLARLESHDVDDADIRGVAELLARMGVVDLTDDTARLLPTGTWATSVDIDDVLAVFYACDNGASAAGLCDPAKATPLLRRRGLVWAVGVGEAVIEPAGDVAAWVIGEIGTYR